MKLLQAASWNGVPLPATQDNASCPRKRPGLKSLYQCCGVEWARLSGQNTSLCSRRGREEGTHPAKSRYPALICLCFIKSPSPDVGVQGGVHVEFSLIRG